MSLYIVALSDLLFPSSHFFAGVFYRWPKLSHQTIQVLSTDRARKQSVRSKSFATFVVATFVQSYPVISTSLISTSRYLDINLWSRQKQSLFNIKLPGYLDISISTSRYLDINLRSRPKQSLFKEKLPGYLDISISTTRYLDIISNPLEEKLDIWYFKICKNVWNWKENI